MKTTNQTKFGFLKDYSYIHNMNKDNKSSQGLGLGTILFLIFLTLKLGGWGVVATWSWWWVTAPLWIPLGAIFVISAIIGLVVYINSK